jgi:methionyl-tRNA formyltransferase
MKQTVLDLPRLGCVNVHASLLPKYRGAAPMHRVLMNGEKETGVTIIQLVLKMDAGDMLHSEKIDIPLSMTFPELEAKLCEVGIRCLLKVIQDFKGGIVTREAQDHSHATYADKVTVEECLIDWKKPAFQLHNLIRGATPNPGAWCYITVRGQKKRLKILRSEYIPELFDMPGKPIFKSKNCLIVAAGKGGLSLMEVQLEGKQAISIAEFLRGISPQDISFI